MPKHRAWASHLDSTMKPDTEFYGVQLKYNSNVQEDSGGIFIGSMVGPGSLAFQAANLLGVNQTINWTAGVVEDTDFPAVNYDPWSLVTDVKTLTIPQGRDAVYEIGRLVDVQSGPDDPGRYWGGFDIVRGVDTERYLILDHRNPGVNVSASGSVVVELLAGDQIKLADWSPSVTGSATMHHHLFWMTTCYSQT